MFFDHEFRHFADLIEVELGSCMGVEVRGVKDALPVFGHKGVDNQFLHIDLAAHDASQV